MKSNKLLYAVFAGLFIGTMFTSCEVDNYDEPDHWIKGHIVYDGKPLGLRGTNQSVSIELWERGYGKEAAQVVFVGQDGSFSTATYGKFSVRLVAKDGLGPWENRHDTVYINDVQKMTTVDYPVIPFYTISDERYELSPDSILTAKFTVTQVSEQAQVGQMGLLVNKTQFVDLSTNCNLKSTNSVTSTGEATMTLDIKDLMKSQKFLFARVYVKPGGCDEAVYSVEPYRVK